MSLGILNNVSAIYAENNLNNTQSSLQTVLQQLSSGARINSGADDAAGLAISNGLSANEAALTQSSLNASDGIGLLQTADGALSQVTNLLDRAVTLATEAANGTLTTAQVSSANQEYQSIITEIGDIGSTTNFNGTSVFSSASTQFYVGDGTSTGSNYYADSVGALTTSSVGLTAPTSSSTAVGVVNTTASSYGGGTGVPAVVTYSVANQNDAVAGTLSVLLGTSTTPTSITFAAGTTVAQAKAQITADSAFSTVTVGGTATTITLTGATPGGAGAVAGDAVVDGGTNLTDSQVIKAYTVNTNAASTTGAGGVVTFNAAQNATTDDIVGTLSVKVGAGGAAVTAQFNPGTTVAQAAYQINNNVAFKNAGISATGASGILVLTGPQDVATNGTNDLITTGTNLQDTPATALPGVGTNFNSSLSTLTTSSAQTVLTGVNAAIANVAYQRGIIGADSNQLTAASNTAASEEVNLTAAQSSILSTNYGQATSDLAKYEVLSQTGISALAQANSVQQEILKLLQ